MNETNCSRVESRTPAGPLRVPPTTQLGRRVP